MTRMDGGRSWQLLAVQAAIVVVVIMLFQQLFRGDITVPIALAVGIGYVAVAELVRRYRD